MGANLNRFTDGKQVIGSDATYLRGGRIGSEPAMLDHSDVPWWLGIRRHGPALGHGRGNGFCLLGNLC